jgi:hypothetical protein
LHIEILLTDREITKRLFWIDFAANGVYFGNCFMTDKGHSSYHADGNRFMPIDINGKQRKIGTFPSFQNLKGAKNLGFYGYPKSVLDNAYDLPSYNPKEFDTIINVETRNFKNGVGCSINLVEANNFEMLGQMANARPEEPLSEVHAFLKCNPWLVILLYGIR